MGSYGRLVAVSKIENWELKSGRERRIGRILRIGLVYLWRITRKVDSD